MAWENHRQVEQIATRLEGHKVISIVEGDETTALNVEQLRGMGFSVVLYAVTTLFAAAKTSLACCRTSSNPAPRRPMRRR